MPRGRYRVTLHFAEVWFPKAGKRSFDVHVEDRRVLDAYEPKVRRAESIPVEVEVDDGELAVTFTHRLDNPKISGIEIEHLR